MKDRISVIVPVHNTEPYLERCIDSIISQTNQNFELILVDNGSVDCSGSICDRYAKTNDKVIAIHQADRGSAGGRNTGLDYVFQHGQSEWITFIDSDDWVSPQYLEVLLDAAKGKNISVCRYRIADKYEKVNVFPPVKQTSIKTEVFYCDYIINAVVPWGKLYKKDCFREVRFPEGVAHEDEFTTYRILFEFDYITFIDEPLYVYFYNPNSVVNSKWNPKEMDKLDAVNEQIRYFKDRSFKKAYTRATSYYFSSAHCFLKQAEEAHYEQEAKKLKKLLAKHTFRYGFRLIHYRLHNRW